MVVETNQDNVDHHKVRPVYGGQDLSQYIGINTRCISVIICGVACDGIHETIGAEGQYLIPKLGIPCY